MKKYLLTLLVSLVAVTAFAQEAQEDMFKGSSEIIACYGNEIAIENAIGLDANGSVVAGVLLLIDPATDSISGGSNITFSSLTKDDSQIKAEGTLIDWDALEYVLEVNRAAEDLSYEDEDKKTVSLPTYVGTLSVSEKGNTPDVVNVNCVVQQVPAN